MTTLIAWISVDTRGPTAAYLASDSRITWGPEKRWDSGRKLFASSTTADLFGYAGEAFFPSQALGQALDLVDRSILWSSQMSPEERHLSLLQFLQTAYHRRHNAPEFDFSIVHVARGGSREFKAWTISYVAKNRSWIDTSIGKASDRFAFRPNFGSWQWRQEIYDRHASVEGVGPRQHEPRHFRRFL